MPGPDSSWQKFQMLREFMDQDQNQFDQEISDDDFYEVVSTPEEFKSGSYTAKLTLKPTSTTNPARPRTVAAGYDFKNFILTVVFPDGTWYNYYDVPQTIWEEFKMANSKGRYLKASGLDDWPSRGKANIGEMPASRRAALVSVTKSARELQKVAMGIQGSGETRGKVITINGQEYRI